MFPLLLQDHMDSINRGRSDYMKDGSVSAEDNVSTPTTSQNFFSTKGSCGILRSSLGDFRHTAGSWLSIYMCLAISVYEHVKLLAFRASGCVLNHRRKLKAAEVIRAVAINPSNDRAPSIRSCRRSCSAVTDVRFHPIDHT